MSRTNPLASSPRRAPRHIALAAAALAVTLSACVSRPATSSGTAAESGAAAGGAAAAGADTTTPGTVVTLHREGGIAGLVTDATVDGVTHRFQTVTRRMCGAEGANCPPATDSAAGTLSDSLATAVARAVDAADFYSLRADYGTDPKLRDGFLYVVTVRRGARTASVRGDDMTRPPALATLTSEVEQVIGRARGR